MTDGPATGAANRGRPVGSVLGVILAGGQSRRMGEDKGLVQLGGKPMIAHAIDRLRPQVDLLIINANGDPARYAGFGVPVVEDTIAGRPGPLAGLLTAMRWAGEHAPTVTHVAMAPVDTPFFPADIVIRMQEALDRATGAELGFAATVDRRQPLFALADIGLADDLERDIIAGSRRVADWLCSRRHAEVLFEDRASFFNANTPEDLMQAQSGSWSEPHK